MIIRSSGNLLLAKADALVNTVNTVGVMGKGIALQFRNAYPELYKSYVAACAERSVKLGHMDIHDQGGLVEGPRWIINFPTKGHWKAKSRIVDVESGLEDLVRAVKRLGIRSIAIPPLGCGNGGLDWADVRPLIESAFAPLNDVEVLLYGPSGAPEAAAMPIKTVRPRLTVTSASLITLIQRYLNGLLDPIISLLEVQKLMYFMQVCGYDFKLSYSKGIYGPYAPTLSHVLKRLEGHYIQGHGDGSDKPGKPIELLENADSEAANLLSRNDRAAKAIDSVASLIEGYEDALGMELLSTVHWVLDHYPKARQSPSLAVELVHAWNPRKKVLMRAEHIEKAWTRIVKKAWHWDEHSPFDDLI